MRKHEILKHRSVIGVMLFALAVLFTWGANAMPFASYEQPEPPDAYVYENEQDIPFVPYVAPLLDSVDVGERPSLEPLPEEYLNRLLNFDYLISRMFLVDPETILFSEDIDSYAFLQADLSIDRSVEGPKVLVFHTHSAEMFSGSNPEEPMTGVVGVGYYLAQILNEVHGIETKHYAGRFDIIGEGVDRRGSYERMEPVIRQILADNPSIQVVIDLHRDGVGDHVPPFVTYIDGMRTAQIMFFNGLSRRIRNGEAEAVPWLPNPYQRENLNFSFQLQVAANQLYPGLARRIYLRAFRYSLHMMPLSMLVEVGNQHNTQQDALNAMYPLADIIAAVVAP